MNKINKIEWYDDDDDEAFELENYHGCVTLCVEYMYQWIILKRKDYKNNDVDLLSIYNNMDAVGWSWEKSNEEIEEEKKEIENSDNHYQRIKAARLRRKQKQ
jgi:hypothetical protein